MLRGFFATALLALLVGLLAGPATVFAQGGESVACPPGITVDLPANGISLESTTTTVRLDMTLCNGTDQREQVQFATSGAPEGWTVVVRPTVGLYHITKLGLAAGASKKLELRIKGPSDESAADFVAKLQVLSGEGAPIREEQIAVERAAGAPAKPGEIKVTSTYPILSGPSTSLFEFELAVVNNTAEDVSLDLDARTPVDWGVVFLPAFGKPEKLISNVSIPATLNQRIKVRVTPPHLAKAGDYPILVHLVGKDYETAIPLQVTLTGSFEVTLTTPDGRLNVNANAGDTTSALLRVVNTGTAEVKGLSLSADAPAEWQVVFAPSSVEALPVGNLIDMPMNITPPGDAVPGDYLITLRARNADVKSQLSMRVTVEKSTIWQWVGIGLLVVVIGALIGMFVKLGRR